MFSQTLSKAPFGTFFRIRSGSSILGANVAPSIRFLRQRAALQHGARLSSTVTINDVPSAVKLEQFDFVHEIKRPDTPSAVLHRTLKTAPLQVVSAEGTYLTFSNGQRIMDTTCGAAVACIGYNNKRVKQAMVEQIDKFAYCNSMFFGHPIGEQLAAELVEGTGGVMSKAYIMSSGSEAMESAMKMARQYFMELSPRQNKRINFIAREGSYHGTTLGSLSMSGQVARRSLFVDMLLPHIHRVSACNAYRGMSKGQTVEEYVQQLADELDQKFQDLDPETICAFVAEPVVGATLGCVPAVSGYFKAMKKIEFVADNNTKEPFSPSAGIANAVHQKGLAELGISLYPGTGTKNGVEGDHVLLAPVYTSTKEEIEEIAMKVRDTVFRTFDELRSS